MKGEVLEHEHSQSNSAAQAERLVVAVVQAHGRAASVEARAQVHHPETLLPSADTAYSSRTTPIWRKLNASISFSTTAMCGISFWVALAAGVTKRASFSRVSLSP